MCIEDTLKLLTLRRPQAETLMERSHESRMLNKEEKLSNYLWDSQTSFHFLGAGMDSVVEC
jgi:hypothetical protein